MVFAWWELIALALVGLFGGAVNVMAGGGSVLTVPAMIVLGLPGPIANGTNRVAILAQNVTAAITFHRHGRSDWSTSLRLLACCLPGAAAGAWLGTHLSGELFNRILALVMLAVLVLMQFGNKHGDQAHHQPRPLLGYGLMVLAGFWGGFIQIGMGFILMPIMHRVLGMDLVTVNVHKVAITAGYTIVALIIFVLNSEVVWLAGAVLAAGMAAGGYLGARLTLAKGEKLIRRVMTIAIIALVARLLFF